MNTAIKIENLEYFYRHQWTGKKIRALHPFSLEIQRGECFGFLGHNGAGKTTTIKALLGLIRPARGKIEIFGKPSSEPSSRKLVGYVSEQPYFYDHLTVEEIVSMYAALSGLKTIEISVAEALHRLNIYDRRKSPMRSLSKGLTQRVAIAQAICHRPSLLVLDEPFSGLDPVGRKEIRDLFADLVSDGTTIFMSSHILSDVETLCNRASIMVKGELKGVYNLKEKDLNKATGFELTLQNDISDDLLKLLGGKIIKLPNYQRLSFDSRKDAEAALKTALDKNIKIERFEASQQSLEDLFVSLVNQSK